MTSRLLSQSISRCLLVLGISISLGMMFFSIAKAQSIELIEQLHVHIEVAVDGTLRIEETIAYDFGDLQRHGIFREIHDTHTQPATAWYKDRFIILRPVSVTRNGVPEPYENEARRGLYLRIGDADKTITGKHEYIITYVVEGALSQFSDTTELYWNVTGNQWKVPIKRTEVVLQVENAAVLGAQSACYAGQPGDSQSCQNIIFPTAEEQNVVTFVHDQVLNPGEELTVAQELRLTQPIEIIEEQNLIYFVLGVTLIWFYGLGIYLYRWKTRYRNRQAIIAQYEPYQQFQPLFTGVLFDNRLDARDITAGIVSLAEQGFISITQKSAKVLYVFQTHDYEIELLKTFSEAKSLYAEDLLGLLFTEPSDSLIPVGTKVLLSTIKKSQTKLIKNAKVITQLQATVKSRLITQDFLETDWLQRTKIILLGFIVLGVVSMVVVGGDLMTLFNSPVAILLLLFIPLSLGIVMLFAADRRTTKGYEAMYHLKGFQDFLSVTEKERYTFHNAPSKSPEQFMQFLPYAIAFGVEKQWSEVFSDISMSAPGWYHSEVAGSHFSAAVFTSELSAFSTALTSSTSPASGSAGSGFSGGGSGGGGGGSW